MEKKSKEACSCAVDKKKERPAAKVQRKQMNRKHARQIRQLDKLENCQTSSGGSWLIIAFVLKGDHWRDRLSDSNVMEDKAYCQWMSVSFLALSIEAVQFKAER